MKSLKILFVAVILTCFVGVTQTKAQAFILRGVESGGEPFPAKPMLFEIDGVTYWALAEMEFQLENTPSLNLNWSSHGQIIEIRLGGDAGEVVEDIELKKLVNVRDARQDFGDKITITPNGKVNVTNHYKNYNPFGVF